MASSLFQTFLSVLTFTVKFMGYQTAVQKVTVSKENVKKTIIRLKAEVKSLDEVVVMGKSESRKIEQPCR